MFDLNDKIVLNKVKCKKTVNVGDPQIWYKGFVVVIIVYKNNKSC